MDDKSNLNPRKIDRVNSKKCKLVNKSEINQYSEGLEKKDEN